MTAYDIIIKPVVTERSMENMESKRYTFKVDTKNEYYGKKKKNGS